MIKTKCVYVENYGCTSNKFDLEIMLAFLKEINYEKTNDIALADILLINTCGVKKATEDRIFGRLISLKKLLKPIIISGCLPKINFQILKKIVPNYAAILDPYSIQEITSAVKEIEEGKTNNLFLSNEPKCKLMMSKIRSGRIIEIVQVSEGCLGSCVFCGTRLARGKLFSYQPKLIVEKIKKVLMDGIKELWITSQDSSAYGLDIGSNLAELLEEICNIDGKFLVRVGMMNPNHTLKILNELIDIYKNDKIFKFLHLPIQSGNNEVLQSMNRKYSVDDFIKIITSFRKEIPKITLATDIICGFPTEDEIAFKDSINFINQIQPDIVNVSKFFPRPKTPAVKMKLLPDKVVKMRSKNMAETCKTIAQKRNNQWLNWKGEILLDEIGKNESIIGRNFAYKPIVIKENEDLGKTLVIEIKKAFPTYLEGKVIK